MHWPCDLCTTHTLPVAYLNFIPSSTFLPFLLSLSPRFFIFCSLFILSSSLLSSFHCILFLSPFPCLLSAPFWLLNVFPVVFMLFSPLKLCSVPLSPHVHPSSSLLPFSSPCFLYCDLFLILSLFLSLTHPFALLLQYELTSCTRQTWCRFVPRVLPGHSVQSLVSMQILRQRESLSQADSQSSHWSVTGPNFRTSSKSQKTHY